MINFGFISLDILIVLIAIVLLIAISFKFGKKPLVSLILSVYPALLIFLNLPFLTLDSPTAEAVVFVVLFVITFLGLNRNVKVHRNVTTLRKFIDYSLLSVSFVLLFFSIYIHAVQSLDVFYSFSDEVTNVVSKVPFGLALIIPLVIVCLINKRES